MLRSSAVRKHSLNHDIHRSDLNHEIRPHDTSIHPPPQQSSTDSPVTPRRTSPSFQTDVLVADKQSRPSLAQCTPNSSVPATRGQNGGGKSCCLCCWRCCKCNNNSSSRTDNKSTDSLLLELCKDSGSSPPTLEEIRSWAESFDKLMSCPVGRLVFKEFLRCEYSEENIMFYLACEELKNNCEPTSVEEKARTIYEDYISILSPREVSLDSQVREVVNTKMRTPDINTFDEAQKQIYTLMHRDSYPRFVTSSVFRRLAQLGDSGSRRESMAN